MDGLLRVVSGPNVGACFVLGERTRLGRAADADIQLDEAHVSRHHARIVRTDDGGFELSDLGSKVGTIVNGEPVERRRLQPNDVIAIGRSRFSFEFGVGEVTASRFRHKARGFEALRPTQPLPTIPAAQESAATEPAKRRRRRTTARRMRAVSDTPAPGRKVARAAVSAELPFVSPEAEPPPPKTQAPRHEEPAPSAVRGGAEALLDAILGPELDAVVSMASTQAEAANEDSGPKVSASAPTKPEPAPSAAPEPAPAPEPASRPSRPDTVVRAAVEPIVAAGSGAIEVDPDAREAALKVLRDVLDYRALRLDELRGSVLDRDAKARFAALSTRLLVDTHGLPASRRFVRVGCRLPATLTQSDGAFSRTLELVLADLSAGGARLAMHDPAVRVGDEVWLAFDLAALFSFGQKVVFRSRVVWTSERLGSTGLMFGGNARFVDTVEAAIATTG